ncbi:MAG: hypothetical protein VX868_00490 [Chloroflexota bacterium]|jgi:hypothetical protein|nr:hypothetical protein [Chloroflexota bacterium]|tara:strand:+ start:508 stop:1122 length:615 start_codon:yes stop_codon:yes gene_type:complete
MNSKVIGLMLILGTILTMGVWMVYNIETSDLSPSDTMTAILADKNKAEIGSILNVFGVMSLFTGLYFLSKSLKSDNTVSNHFSEIGGLLLLLCVPLWVVLVGAWLPAISEAEKFGNDVGATIIASSTALQMGGILLVVGLFMLGISLTLLRKYKGIIGILFIIASVSAFIDMVFEIDIMGMIGWMGMFLMILVTGILTTLKKEN